MILFVGTNVGFPQKQGRRSAVQQMPPKREVKASAERWMDSLDASLAGG